MTGIIAGVIRHALTTFGGALVTNGTLSDTDLQAAVGAVLTLVGIGWSILSKRARNAN